MTHPAATTVRSAQGLDVSNFQGKFAWSATSGLSFGIHRLTQGLSTPGTNSPDPTAQWNPREIAKRGLHRGAYPSSTRSSPAPPGRPVRRRLPRLGLTPQDMLWLDNENPAQPRLPRDRGVRPAFMAELDKLCPAPARRLHVSSASPRAGTAAGLDRYALWIAHPAAPRRRRRGEAVVVGKFWQYGIRNGWTATRSTARARTWTRGSACSRRRPRPSGPCCT